MSVQIKAMLWATSIIAVALVAVLNDIDDDAAFALILGLGAAAIASLRGTCCSTSAESPR